MAIFRLVAAARSWQRLAKQKSQPAALALRFESTFQLQPCERQTFAPNRAKRVLEDVLETGLKHVTYDPEKCGCLTADLAAALNSRIKGLGFSRYKLVCNVIIMENKGQGSEVASRGLLNVETDSFASHSFQNSTLIAVAFVHGLYWE